MLRRVLWEYMVKRTARAHGFLDPIGLFSRLSRFAQPSEVLAPTELLRATAVLHARGLLNAQVIQHNLDWIWPYWVNKQFNPHGKSFIPRSFSLTHINLTHRNWTAVGLPDVEDTPLVDPCGLVTPFWDGWSVDCWIVNEENKNLLPSRIDNITQRYDLETNSVITESVLDDMHLSTKVRMIKESDIPVCEIKVLAQTKKSGDLVVSIRPSNPEGVSLIHQIELLEDKQGWKVNSDRCVYLSEKPCSYLFSNFKKGDVYHQLNKDENQKSIHCAVEMASSAAKYQILDFGKKELTITIPLSKKPKKRIDKPITTILTNGWDEILENSCKIDIGDKHFQYLFETSLRTILMHTAIDVYAGPYTYKRFWFRDAVFITYSLLCCGLHKRAEQIIDHFAKRQKRNGYFESQEGEWDSNGQVLWLIHKYCQLTNSKPKDKWKEMIYKGTRWILNKRLSDDLTDIHAGLMPAGFSAEHFGPNDYYYWDDFWSIGGLEAAAQLVKEYQDNKKVELFSQEAKLLRAAVEKSLQTAAQNVERLAIPSSPYRRLDTSAVGSLVCGYPLQLNIQKESRLFDTVEYLMENCLVNDGFFHDMSHSGINPYLTLHISQILLNKGDDRYLKLMKAVAKIASPTGQWPEAVHPTTNGGCMGDGQHTWAAAEWIIMMRNCFVREVEKENKLILCSGIPVEWLKQNKTISFGPVFTIYGGITVSIECHEKKVNVEWTCDWYKDEPVIEIKFPNQASVFPKTFEESCSINIS